uniref:Uncharacterized protein n=1 Tax=Rhizophora mucronata TaxID=61149 RepID=A0A2P2PW95_RHIMU
MLGFPQGMFQRFHILE